MSDPNVIGNTPAPSDTGGTPAPAPTGAPAPQATYVAPASPSAVPGGSPAPATGAPGDGWVPSYRVRETREAAFREAQSHYERQLQNQRTEFERVQKQLQALVGVQGPQNPEIDQVRKQFGQLYPGLAKLEERYGDIEGILARAGDFETQNQHYWQTYGQQTINKLFNLAQESYGQPLNDEQKRGLHTSFLGFVQSSPEMTQRYASDPTLVEEYWKVFSSSFIDPARRAATTQVAGRVPAGLPQDSPGGAPRTTPVPQAANLDERAAQAWAAYQHSQLNK